MVIKWVTISALVGGAAGFLVGSVGTLISMPHSNLWPIAGIFLTGPIGLVVGAVTGLIIGLAKK